MTTALGVVVMLVLGWTGVGTYAGPLIAALMLVPVQRHDGSSSALLVWAATGFLSLLLVSDKELAMLYFAVLGWYPAARPRLERLPKVLSMGAKLLLFNAALAASYWVMVFVMGLADSIGEPLVVGLMLILGNVTFLLEDLCIIPKTIPVLEKRLPGDFFE